MNFGLLQKLAVGKVFVRVSEGRALVSCLSKLSANYIMMSYAPYISFISTQQLLSFLVFIITTFSKKQK